ncbi:ABC1 family-domain-containing protein [Leucosporidium creatinivorum]|uniref:ABC1 family-domain-containing protein n=1 Tax=Leucosporidium creatinivorum TaxID=106004 RepID=A0A1Y2DBB6_9BASI|nr:ABC1 family-domain-containing protein [Leucosporidium creatinivorum]
MLKPRPSYFSSLPLRSFATPRSSALSNPSSPQLFRFSRPFPGRSFSSTSPKSNPSKNARRARTAAGIFLAGAGLYAWDRQFNAGAVGRTLRTAYHASIMAADFKLNFNPSNSEQIDALHERVAHRIHHLCITNGGLYIKLAQSLAIQAAILPKPYRDAFANVFDAAPSVSFEEAVKVFKKEFGVHPDEAFDEFGREPIASASIAQVHRARLKRKEGEPDWKDGEGYVAVKIRKPEVPIQVEWDLFSYRSLMYLQEALFDLPVAFIARYVSDQMRKEVSLRNEAQNAERAGESIRGEPTLRDRVTVPKVYWEWTGESVMTAEFITACKLTDKAALDKYRLSYRAVMDAANAVFAAQTFKFGFVQADPHPGNILVRPHPQHPGKPQVVLIDHGLYVELPEQFRHQYSLLWRSLFVGDISTIESIVESWGIAKENSEIFASLTLLRPHKLRDQKKKKQEHGQEENKQEMSSYEKQVGLKERLKTMLKSQELIPRELILLGRSQRMMQSNNQALGSPSNRINSMAHWAVEGLKLDLTRPSQTLHSLGLRTFALEKARLLIFRVVLLVVDVGFAITQARQWLFKVFGSKRQEDFETILQRQVSELAKNEFGVDIDESAFTG